MPSRKGQIHKSEPQEFLLIVDPSLPGVPAVLGLSS